MKLNLRCLSLNFLVLSLVLYQSVVSFDSCPEGCYCLKELLDCKNPTFPMYLPTGFIDIVSIRGKISRIPANAFVQPEESALNTLSINQLEVSRIDSNAFSNLMVDSVSFYNVKIDHLSPRIFSNLTCNQLSIYNSAIDVMPTSLFEGVTSGSLSIYNNNITTLQTDVFKSASLRTPAAFYHNKIYTAQKNAFKASFSMNIYLNKIKTFLLQDSVVPKSFHSNKFQCSCDLVWMWEKDSPFKYFLNMNTCLGPHGKPTVLDKMDKATLCKHVDVTHTSGIWNQPTTKSNTGKFEPARPTSKGTTRLENFTERPSETAAADRSGTENVIMNMVMIVTVTVATCLFISF